MYLTKIIKEAIKNYKFFILNAQSEFLFFMDFNCQLFLMAGPDTCQEFFVFLAQRCMLQHTFIFVMKHCRQFLNSYFLNQEIIKKCD